MLPCLPYWLIMAYEDYGLRVSSRDYKVEAGMDSSVVEVDEVSLNLQFFLKIGLKLMVDVIHNCTAAAGEGAIDLMM